MLESLWSAVHQSRATDWPLTHRHNVAEPERSPLRLADAPELQLIAAAGAALQQGLKLLLLLGLELGNLWTLNRPRVN